VRVRFLEGCLRRWFYQQVWYARRDSNARPLALGDSRARSGPGAANVPVPDFQSFFMPVLRLTSDGNEHTMAELRERIAEDLKLTLEDLSQKVPSGVPGVFANRVAWSTVYMTKAVALERVRRGVFRITRRGKDLLDLKLAKLTIQHLSKYAEFVAFHRGTQDGGEDGGQEVKVGKTETPEEQLASAYMVLRKALASDVLEAVKKAPPTFFEELVIGLLVATGYGGSVEDAAKAVGKTGDGGIDGTIGVKRLDSDCFERA
jgi:restriction system protein